MSETVIACRDLRKTCAQGKLNVPVLKGIDLDIARQQRRRNVLPDLPGRHAVPQQARGENATGGGAEI